MFKRIVSWIRSKGRPKVISGYAIVLSALLAIVFAVQLHLAGTLTLLAISISTLVTHLAIRNRGW